MMATGKVLRGRIDLTAEEIAAEVAEEIEGTAGIVLCGYIGAEDAGRVSEEICEWTERTVYDIIMREN